jgi:hypothetical protein
MSYPRVRFTVRRLMVVVAVVALLLGTFEAGRRWERAMRAVEVPSSPPRVHTSPRQLTIERYSENQPPGTR